MTTSPHDPSKASSPVPAEAPPAAAGAPPTNRRRRIATITAAAIGVALIGGLTGGWIVHAAQGSSGANGSAGACPATAVAETVLPSIVTINVRNGAASGNGSGELIRDGGYILTNDHVISPAAGGGSVGVVFTSGQSEPASIVGRAPTVDLAVLKVADAHGLPLIATGDAEALQVGQPVVALGAPLGLSSTVTSGIVSALGRDMPLPSDPGVTAVVAGAIQTDAAINPGNSGGALVDCRSRLVGINTAIATVPNAVGQAGGGSVGIGFAIPVDLALRVADQLIATGHFSAPYLGVSTAQVPRSVAREAGVSGGLYVQAVASDGPAAAAGLQPGDIITKVDGRETTTPDTLAIHLLTLAPNDEVTIDYVRDGQSNTTTATVVKPPGAGS